MNDRNKLLLSLCLLLFSAGLLAMDGYLAKAIALAVVEEKTSAGLIILLTGLVQITVMAVKETFARLREWWSGKTDAESAKASE